MQIETLWLAVDLSVESTMKSQSERHWRRAISREKIHFLAYIVLIELILFLRRFGFLGDFFSCWRKVSFGQLSMVGPDVWSEISKEKKSNLLVSKTTFYLWFRVRARNLVRTIENWESIKEGELLWYSSGRSVNFAVDIFPSVAMWLPCVLRCRDFETGQNEKNYKNV